MTWIFDNPIPAWVWLVIVALSVYGLLLAFDWLWRDTDR